MALVFADILLDKLIRRCTRELTNKHFDIKATDYSTSHYTKVIGSLINYKHFMRLNESVLDVGKSIEPVSSKDIMY
jgi:hypothetical protein